MSSDSSAASQRNAISTLVLIGLIALMIAVIFVYQTLKPAEPKWLLTGVAESGTIWKAPLSSPSNEGSSIKGHRVVVYETFVVAINPENGTQQICPHGHYSNLILK